MSLVKYTCMHKVSGLLSTAHICQGTCPVSLVKYTCIDKVSGLFSTVYICQGTVWCHWLNIHVYIK